mmetsp:Transcript_22461/g.80137  ORF Transcript_22461/g.80137 Transcript_22461/m.80137 type:complete len:326 (+) Transcript_22461:167-1144(+)
MRHPLSLLPRPQTRRLGQGKEARRAPDGAFRTVPGRRLVRRRRPNRRFRVHGARGAADPRGAVARGPGQRLARPRQGRRLQGVLSSGGAVFHDRRRRLRLVDEAEAPAHADHLFERWHFFKAGAHLRHRGDDLHQLIRRGVLDPVPAIGYGIGSNVLARGPGEADVHTDLVFHFCGLERPTCLCVQARQSRRRRAAVVFQSGPPALHLGRRRRSHPGRVVAQAPGLAGFDKGPTSQSFAKVGQKGSARRVRPPLQRRRSEGDAGGAEEVRLDSRRNVCEIRESRRFRSAGGERRGIGDAPFYKFERAPQARALVGRAGSAGSGRG